ncbi:MAG: SusF/SusE family outer membrane protein [Dysgonomonas sp.]|nr:SusF/SusE family outer membrane protein [Dysgonomonas sp.]
MNPVDPQGEGTNIRITDGITNDYKFQITRPGIYRVFVHKAFMQIQWQRLERPESIYLVGDATPTGWDNTKSEEMRVLYEREGNDVFPCYRWTGFLKKGHFKFILKRGTWISLVPTARAHESIIPGYCHELSENYQGDYRFNITEEGEYDIFVWYKNGDYSLELITIKKDQDVYLLGEATSAGWSNNNPIKMNIEKVEGDRFRTLYTWEGYLNTGHFKFITEPGTWNSLVPVNAAHYDASSEEKHPFTNIYRGDYRFFVTEAGNYKMTFSLREKWFTLTKSTDSRSTIYLVGDATPTGWG